MTSYLIDALLLVALVVTALRSGRLHRELKILRESGPEFGAAIAEADRTMTSAAEVVTSLKYEGVQTVSALETRIAEAGEAADRLQALVDRADRHVGQAATRNRAAADAVLQQAMAGTHARAQASRQPDRVGNR